MTELYMVSVGAGFNQLPLLKALREKGCPVIGFDKNPDAPGREFCSYYKSLSTWDDEKALWWLKSLDVDLAGVTCFSYGKALRTQQRLITNFGLPGGISEQLHCLTCDKHLLREVLQREQLSRLQEFTVDSISSTNSLQPGQTFIIKDPHGVSSCNIIQLTGREIHTLKKSEKLEKNYIVQQLLTGPEYRIIALIQEGRVCFLAVMQRKNLVSTFFTGRLLPLSDRHNNFTLLVETIAQSLCIDQAILKLDVVLENYGFEILEMDFGIGGDFFETKVAPICYEYDFISNYIQFFSGTMIDKQPLESNMEQFCFDYIYNITGMPCCFSYDEVIHAVEQEIGNAHFISIQPEGILKAKPESNLDAVCALIHMNRTLTHFQINQKINSCFKIQ